jgi:hypothetical protein
MKRIFNKLNARHCLVKQHRHGSKGEFEIVKVVAVVAHKILRTGEHWLRQSYKQSATMGKTVHLRTRMAFVVDELAIAVFLLQGKVRIRNQKAFSNISSITINYLIIFGVDQSSNIVVVEILADSRNGCSGWCITVVPPAVDVYRMFYNGIQMRVFLASL